MMTTTPSDREPFLTDEQIAVWTSAHDKIAWGQSVIPTHLVIAEMRRIRDQAQGRIDALEAEHPPVGVTYRELDDYIEHLRGRVIAQDGQIAALETELAAARWESVGSLHDGGAFVLGMRYNLIDGRLSADWPDDGYEYAVMRRRKAQP